MPQPLGAPGPFPDQRLVRARHHLDGRGLRAVPGHRPQLVGVGAHHICQDMSISGVALGAGHAVPFPVPGRLQRVDREHRVPGRDQRGHPRTPVGLDPDRDLPGVVLVSVLAELLADHRVQPGDARHALRQPRLRQPPPGGVHQLDVMMVLGPVIPDKQPQRFLPPQDRSPATSSLRENHQRPNEPVLTPSGAGTTSQQRSTLPASRQGHDLSSGLPKDARGGAVLTCRRLPDPSLPDGRLVSSH